MYNMVVFIGVTFRGVGICEVPGKRIGDFLSIRISIVLGISGHTAGKLIVFLEFVGAGSTSKPPTPLSIQKADYSDGESAESTPGEADQHIDYREELKGRIRPAKLLGGYSR